MVSKIAALISSDQGPNYAVFYDSISGTPHSSVVTDSNNVMIQDFVKNIVRTKTGRIYFAYTTLNHTMYPLGYGQANVIVYYSDDNGITVHQSLSIPVNLFWTDEGGAGTVNAMLGIDSHDNIYLIYQVNKQYSPTGTYLYYTKYTGTWSAPTQFYSLANNTYISMMQCVVDSNDIVRILCWFGSGGLEFISLLDITGGSVAITDPATLCFAADSAFDSAGNLYVVAQNQGTTDMFIEYHKRLPDGSWGSIKYIADIGSMLGDNSYNLYSQELVIGDDDVIHLLYSWGQYNSIDNTTEFHIEHCIIANDAIQSTEHILQQTLSNGSPRGVMVMDGSTPVLLLAIPENPAATSYSIVRADKVGGSWVQTVLESSLPTDIHITVLDKVKEIIRLPTVETEVATGVS
jgi:hypothetical protein